MAENRNIIQFQIEAYSAFENLSKKTKQSQRQLQLKEKFSKFIEKKSFSAELESIQKRFLIPEDGFRSYEDAMAWSKKIGTDYRETLARLFKDYSIHQRWLETIEFYLLFKKYDVHELMPKTVQIVPQLDEKTNRLALFLRIWPEAQKEDVLIEWPAIKAFQGMIESMKNIDYSTMDPEHILSELNKDRSKQQKEITTRKYRSGINKDKRAFLLRKQGKTYKEISKILKCDYNQVGTLVSRFRKKVDSTYLD